MRDFLSIYIPWREYGLVTRGERWMLAFCVYASTLAGALALAAIVLVLVSV